MAWHLHTTYIYLLMHVIFFLLRGRKAYTEIYTEIHTHTHKHNERMKTSTYWFTPQLPQPDGEPNCWNHHHCLPGSMLAQSWHQNLNPHTPVWNTGISTGVLMAVTDTLNHIQIAYNTYYNVNDVQTVVILHCLGNHDRNQVCTQYRWIFFLDMSS